MQYENINVYKNFFFTFTGALLLAILYYFINIGSETALQEARAKTLEFMYYVQHNNFEQAQKMLINDSIDLKKMFTGTGVVLSYNESGYGVDSKTDVWVNIFAGGLPAENRNVNLKLKKINGNWKINNIVVDYHIDRIDKLNVLLFIDKIINNDYSGAHALTKDIDDKQMYKVKDVICKYKKNTDWRIIKAKNLPSPHLKNKIPEETVFYLQSVDKKHTLQIVCKELKNRHWIGEVKILE